ncbi:hypothetical protein SLEP1_g7519 [Rubroshorea leprosula]|uniref:Uncharacterized protein n=1 Tax=Rubroshorea leprosula TaxID=152421 RepID=A0AAV5I384_9ROSI|nr:hypothetical protein SLEP1_g7519 [Rubroshorea leprosula]
MNVNFMGSSHVLVKENVSFSYENIEERKGRNGFKRSSSLENLQREDSEEVNVRATSKYLGSLLNHFLSKMYHILQTRRAPTVINPGRNRRGKRSSGSQGGSGSLSIF